MNGRKAKLIRRFKKVGLRYKVVNGKEILHSRSFHILFDDAMVWIRAGAEPIDIKREMRKRLMELARERDASRIVKASGTANSLLEVDKILEEVNSND